MDHCQLPLPKILFCPPPFLLLCLTGSPLSTVFTKSLVGFPGGSVSDKGSACQCRRHKRCRFDPWVGKIPWRRECQPTPASLSGKSQGQRSLAGYSPWVTKSQTQLNNSAHTTGRFFTAGTPPPPKLCSQFKQTKFPALSCLPVWAQRVSVPPYSLYSKRTCPSLFSPFSKVPILSHSVFSPSI